MKPKYDFKVGERVMVDSKYRNSCEVTIIHITLHKLFARVKADDGYEWETMYNRLTPINSN